MANPEHLEILEQGVECWNKWRRKNPDIIPDLADAQLSGKTLKKVDFSRTDLNGADLSGAILSKADLCGAELSGAILLKATLSEAKLGFALFKKDQHSRVIFKKTNLRKANLFGANLFRANLNSADLRGDNPIKYYLRRAIIKGAKLFGAKFRSANFRSTDLRSADFSEANVWGVKHNRWAKYSGIRCDTCYGSPRFKRFAQDQEFIEEFRSSGWRRYVLYPLWLVFADCGRSLLPWTAWSLFFMVSFAYIFTRLGDGAFSFTEELGWNFWTALYYSVVTFTTLGFGDITPLTRAASCWVMAEVVIGYVMLGGLISIFATKLARRS